MSMSPIQAGKRVFIRTVTHYYLGDIVEVNEHEIIITKACWVADTGRFGDAMAGKSMNEIEPYPVDRHVSIARGTLIDVVEYPYPLPGDRAPRHVCSVCKKAFR